MSSFSEKLAAMEERISGLADKPQENIQESHPRKSRSREKSKKQEPSEDDRTLIPIMSSKLTLVLHTQKYFRTLQ